MSLNSNKKRNLESYVKLFVSIGFSVLMIKLIAKDEIGYFINPKLIPLVIFCIVTLIITSAISFYKVREESNNAGIKITYLIYFIPILIGLIVPARIVTVSSFDDKSSLLQNNWLNSQSQTSLINATTNSQAMPSSKTSIKIDEKNFAYEIDQINMFPQNYKDCKIEMSGKVYRNEKMKNGEFALVRPMMVCCSADTVLSGLLCTGKGADKLANDTWINVKGKINFVSGPKEKSIYIIVDESSSIQKPENEIVYPY